MSEQFLTIILWLLPLVGGLVLAFAKPPEAVAFVNRASAWWESQYQAAKTNSGFFVGTLWRWLIWGFHKLDGWTAAIEDVAIRAGVRAALFFYVAGLSVLLMASAIYLALVVAAIFVGFWLLGKALNNNQEERSRPPSPAAAAGGRSRQRKDMWGDTYTEHTDSEGKRTGTSRPRKDMWGDTFTERRGPDGEVEETSRERKDMFGDKYTEHRDADGQKSGESWDKKDVFGDDYVRHQDTEGEEAGRSEERRDWEGDRYTDHKKKD